jgi:hypothetical protein
VMIEDAWGPHPLEFRPDRQIGARRRGMLRPNAISIHKHVFGSWRWRCGYVPELTNRWEICWGDDRNDTFAGAVEDAIAHARQDHWAQI